MRGILAYLTRETQGRSLTELSNTLNRDLSTLSQSTNTLNRDLSTLSQSTNNIEHLMKKDGAIKKDIQILKAKLFNVSDPVFDVFIASP